MENLFENEEQRFGPKASNRVSAKVFCYNTGRGNIDLPYEDIVKVDLIKHLKKFIEEVEDYEKNTNG